MFNYVDLYGSARSDAHPMYKIYNWLPQLHEQAEKVGIQFMCTAFSPELVAAVDPYVRIHKVASSDACWPQMLEAVAKTGKTVLVSCGATSALEMELIQKHFSEHGDVSCLKFLYCIAAYPAIYVDLSNIPKVYSGFSDHTRNCHLAVDAAKRGAQYIEKHFTAFPSMESPDRLHSVRPDEFTRMVRAIRGDQEIEMYLRHKRRLIATKPVFPGTTLHYGENFGAYRCEVDDRRGLSPFLWQAVDGKKAKSALKKGDPIGGGDFGD